MSIFRASIPVGIGLGLMWGLKGLRAWLTRGRAGGEAALRQPLDGTQACHFGPAQCRPERAECVPPGAHSARSDKLQDTANLPRPVPVRVVTQGHAGWARRRQEHVKEAIGE